MDELLLNLFQPRLMAGLIAGVLGAVSFAMLRPIPVPLAILAGALSGLVALTQPACADAPLHLAAILGALITTATLAALLPAAVGWATGTAALGPSPDGPTTSSALPQLVPLVLAWVWLQAGGALWAARTGAALVCAPTDGAENWLTLVWPLITQVAPPLLALRVSLDVSAALLHHAAPADSPGHHAVGGVVPLLALALLLQPDALLVEPLAAALQVHP